MHGSYPLWSAAVGSGKHDRLAVKVELARLWSLFLPTSLAVAFLVMTAANGTIWKFSLVAQIVPAAEPSYILSIVVRLVLPFGVAALWAWVTERRVPRSAD